MEMFDRCVFLENARGFTSWVFRCIIVCSGFSGRKSVDVLIL